MYLNIPYLIFFGSIFSSVDKSVEGSEELTTVHRMAFMLFRITLIDDYPYAAMREEDEVMALLLVGTFLFITAVVGEHVHSTIVQHISIYDNTLANGGTTIRSYKITLLQLENTYGSCLIDQK